MVGPAVKPTSPPAKAPTGPATTAPDTAPRAASPRRSWALAAIGVKEITAATAATAAAARSLFMISPNLKSAN
jgi:hypothetical protein